MAEKIKAADLEDGRLLIDFKSKFIAEPTQEALLPVLACLRDSVLKVPFIAEMSDEDKKKFSETKENEEFTNSDEVRLTADILKAENGASFFPVFSNDEQMGEEYASRFTVIPVTFIDCLQMAHSDPSVSGLVLDGFTQPMVIPFDLADYAAQFPSALQDKD